MNTTEKSRIKEIIGKLALKGLSSESPLKNFSWNRVKHVLLNISKTNARYYGDYLQLEFILHRHVIWLHTSGYGILYNPYISGGIRYRLVMPYDIQELVQGIWDTNRAPIPINPSLN